MRLNAQKPFVKKPTIDSDCDGDLNLTRENDGKINVLSD